MKSPGELEAIHRDRTALADTKKRGTRSPSPNHSREEEAREIVERFATSADEKNYILVLAAFCAEALSIAIVTTASTAAL